MNSSPFRKAFGQIVACCVVLAAGFGAMQALAWMRTPPAQRPSVERALRVDAVRAQPESVQVTLEGLGQVRALDVVDIAPEVAGKVIAVHPRLDVGEVIREGEIFFEIDARDYQARRAEAAAQVEQLEQTIARWQTQLAIDQERLTSLQRNRDLAQAEFERLKTLFEQDDVGTRSGVDAAERAFHAASDQLDQLKQAVALYPIQIEESRNMLKSAQAALDMAELSLDRTRVRAPFDARIKRASVEVGQYVAPGPAVLTIANDSILEISVPLDSREARSWLQFKPGADLRSDAWFNELDPVECRISWTEDAAPDAAKGDGWRGTLHRVERFDEATRTVTVAIRVQGKDALSANAQIPLVDGMFCSVQIPGRAIDGVYRLPRHAVGFTGEVYVAVGENRGALAFERSSIQDPVGLAQRILDGGDPVAQYVRGKVHAPIAAALAEVEAQQRKALEDALALLDSSNGGGIEAQREVVERVHAELEAYVHAHSPEDRLVEVLIEQLNSILQDNALYDEARFRDVDLPADLVARLAEPATAEDRMRLNRRLLEAAFPDTLGESFRLQQRKVDIVRQNGETTLVRGELAPGELVVTTRLVNPLQNTLLDVAVADEPMEFAAR